MRITRVAAVGAVSGAVTLALAAPVEAAPAGPTITATPKRFKPGDNLNLKVTLCEDPPKTGFLAGPNEIFAEDPTFDKVGKDYQAIGGTNTSLKPGKTYKTTFKCPVGGKTAKFTLTLKVPVLPKTPSETPTPTPDPNFEFGFDKVDLSTRTVTPKGKMGFTVTCPSSVTAESSSFSKAPEFKKTAEDTFKGEGTFKATLPSIVTIKVTCKDYGSVTYSTEPGKDNIGNGGPKIPKGAPNTGDGSTLGGGTALTLGGGAALALAGAAGLGGLALRRRTAKAARENA